MEHLDEGGVFLINFDFLTLIEVLLILFDILEESSLPYLHFVLLVKCVPKLPDFLEVLIPMYIIESLFRRQFHHR